uniref:Uncharacterized protein n=1 Tax=Arundo donax TaxID=35708 RepID=A0A0A9B8I8_ARUDO
MRILQICVINVLGLPWLEGTNFDQLKVWPCVWNCGSWAFRYQPNDALSVSGMAIEEINLARMVLCFGKIMCSYFLAPQEVSIHTIHGAGV